VVYIITKRSPIIIRPFKLVRLRDKEKCINSNSEFDPETSIMIHSKVSTSTDSSFGSISMYKVGAFFCCMTNAYVTSSLIIDAKNDPLRIKPIFITLLYILYSSCDLSLLIYLLTNTMSGRHRNLCNLPRLAPLSVEKGLWHP
jgi:hypothetical protein